MLADKGVKKSASQKVGRSKAQLYQRQFRVRPSGFNVEKVHIRFCNYGDSFIFYWQVLFLPLGTVEKYRAGMYNIFRKNQTIEAEHVSPL